MSGKDAGKLSSIRITKAVSKIFFLDVGEIVPGERIGIIRLGDTLKNILSLSQEFVMKDLPNHQLLIGGDVRIWIDRERRTVTQILVHNSFSGRFERKFGIGTFLSEMEKALGEETYEESDAFFFPSHNGVCFELKDIEDDWDDLAWFKSHSPIECISVF